MEQDELFRQVLDRLEQLQIVYMVVGSAASSIYGEPRFTRDIDIVIDPTPEQLEQLCGLFPSDDFYLSPEAARDAMTTGGQFNVIHPESGNKIDFMVSKKDQRAKEQIRRRRTIQLLPGRNGTAAAPEDIVLSKMLYYQEGGSEKHLRDITGMLKILRNEVDRNYISTWAAKLGLTDIWQSILKRLGA